MSLVGMTDMQHLLEGGQAGHSEEDGDKRPDRLRLEKPAQLCVYPAGRLHLPTVLDGEGSQEVELGGQGGQQQAAGVLYLQEGRG